MVSVRKAIEQSYIGTCSIWENKKHTRPNGSTGFEPQEVESDVPCRVSFKTINESQGSQNASRVATEVKLFINPDLIIKEGSKITVTQNGRINEYGRSGEPAVYFSHQEIILESFKGWS